jgi:co-chaperonin GroES (HSP10)
LRRASGILKSDNVKGKQMLGNVNSLGEPSKDEEKGKSGKLALAVDDEFEMKFSDEE